MNYAFLSKSIFCLVVTLFSSFFLFGEADVEQGSVKVGSRVSSMEDHIAKQHKRARLAAENAEKEDSSTQEDQKTEKRARSNFFLFDVLWRHNYPYILHPGAYHQAVGVSLSGDTLQLEDGSIWSISLWDQHKTLNWFESDVLIVTPNHSWVTSCLFRIKNQATGESVEANLEDHHRCYLTHWIIDIDYANGLVWLEDRSVWEMTDLDVVYQWLVNDVVIIGIDDRWFSRNPNILINAYTLDYASGISTY